MRRCTTIMRFLIAAWLLPALQVAGAPASAYQAQRAVEGWLREDARPMHAAMARRAGQVQTFTNAGGEAIYHVISMAAGGFVVVSADDALEPIVAFSATGHFGGTEDNPLFSLLQRDLEGRILAVRGKQRRPSSGSGARARTRRETQIRGRWDRLLQMADGGGMQLKQLGGVSDVRVAPLLQSTWGQSTVSRLTCYNYYTPNSYAAGCVATMMAQLMRYHEWPASGGGVHSYSISVDGVPQLEALRGGDGNGGAYDWQSMPLTPDATITLAERRMIGSLVHDAGVSVNMAYTASSSAASTWDAADELVNRFGYSNSIKGYNSGSNIGPGLAGMVTPNLNAGWPVMLAVRRDGGGHAIVCDGYGYQGATLYHHVNMGWSGTDNAWYNLPDIDAYYHYTSIDTCVYNIYSSGGGEIISGRVVDSDGIPMQGITVTADNGFGLLNDVTDANGLYAIVHTTASTTYRVGIDYPGYVETNQDVLVGQSIQYQAWSGNRDGIDFELSLLPVFDPGDASVITGTVSYAGAETGVVVVVAFTNAMMDHEPIATVEQVIPGPYTFSNLYAGTYYVAAVMLLYPLPDADHIRYADPWGFYESTTNLVPVAVAATQTVAGIDVVLQDGTLEQPNPFAAGITPSDFDGDGVTDLAIFDQGTGRWFIRRVDGQILVWDVNWGWPGAQPVSGDYDGDGIDDLAILDQATGRWFIKRVDKPILAWDVNWGWPGVQPVPGDYDGDGIDDLAILDQGTGRWFIKRMDGEILAWDVNWGWPGVDAVPGDYDGDGVFDLAIFDGNTGRWFIRTLSGSQLALDLDWGWPGVQPVGR